jgi:LysM repeat protein
LLFKEGAFRLRTLFSLRSVHPRLAALTAVALAALCTLTAQPVQAQNDNGSYGPIVAIASPEYADVLKSLESIVISITPRRYPAQTIELLVDGKSITGAIPAQTKFKWDTKLFIDGPHTLSVRVTDTQGFIGQAETMIYINNSNLRTETGSPVLSWGGVQNGQNLSGTAKIQLSAGSDFGVKYVFLNVNSAITPDVKPPLASWMTNRPPYEFSLDTTRFKDGLYVLDAYAWDAMDNERLAPRLTVGFYNHGLNATTLQNPAPASAGNNTEKAASSSNTPRIASSASTSPSTTLPPSSSELLKTPGAYTVTTRNGWGNNTPAQTEVETPTASQRTSTVVSARVSDPTRIASNLPEAPATGSAASNNQAESATQPGVTLASSKATQIETPVTGSAAASTPEIEAQNPAPSARVSEPSRIARNMPAAPARPETAGQPKTTVSGTVSDAPIATSTVATTNVTENSSHTAAKISEPSRIARTLPATPAQPAAALPEVRWTAPSRFEAAQPGSAVANIVPLETPASVVANSGSSNLTSDTQRNTNAARISALPSTSLPGKAAANVTSSNSALLSVIDSNSYNSRLISAAPTSLSRINSTLALPTLPRLALTPDLSQPSTPANVAQNNAIVVSRGISEPIVYVAQRNETLVAIAMRNKVPLATLANANNLPHNARIKQGESVVLPQALQISYNGQAVTGDVAPFLIGSTSIAPFRFMFEKQGGTMEWDAANRRVIARNGDHEVTINIGSNVALVNQEEVMMDVAAFLLSGRTMVPVRFFEKAMQAKVEWEPTTGRIYVAMTP